jgi:HSP20 family protein
MAAPIRSRNADDVGRWSPFADLNQLARQMERFLGSAGDLAAPDGFVPMADVEETEDAYLVELELPGVKREDINIEVAGNRLLVTGERKERERVGIVRRRTRTVGRFQFEVVLPIEVSGDAVEATLEHGVLTVRVPKTGREEPHRVEIR